MKTLDELTNGGKITQAIRDYYAQFGLRPCCRADCRKLYPIEDFTIDKSKIDNIGHVCMVCRVKQCLENKTANDKYKKEHYQENKLEILDRQFKQKNGRSKARKEAEKLTRIALKNGTLIKPKKCSRCPNIERIEAHHHDYDKPLDIIWLCKSCHQQEHARLNRKNRVITDCVATT